MRPLSVKNIQLFVEAHPCLIFFQKRSTFFIVPRIIPDVVLPAIIFSCATNEQIIFISQNWIPFLKRCSGQSVIALTLWRVELSFSIVVNNKSNIPYGTKRRWKKDNLTELFSFTTFTPIRKKISRLQNWQHLILKYVIGSPDLFLNEYIANHLDMPESVWRLKISY